MNIQNLNNQRGLQTKWLDSPTVMQMMKVNNHTLETWCKLKVVVHCIRQDKIYYDAADIEWLQQLGIPLYK